MKHHKSGLFLMEVIISILFFALASALCIQFFVKAKTMNDESIHLGQASRITSNIIEIAQNDGFVEGKQYFDENGDSCQKDQACYQALIKKNDDSYRIEIYYDQQSIYHLNYYHYEQKEVLS